MTTCTACNKIIKGSLYIRVELKSVGGTKYLDFLNYHLGCFKNRPEGLITGSRITDGQIKYRAAGMRVFKGLFLTHRKGY